MTRLELAIQLVEGQPAFHFAFIPRKLKKRLRLHRLVTALRALLNALRAFFPSISTNPLAVVWYAVSIAVFEGPAIDLSPCRYSALSFSLTLRAIHRR
jgi:hypothetical protein